MSIANFRKALAASVPALALAACGGESGGGATVAFIPPPPVVQPPAGPTAAITPANYIVAATTPNQDFVSRGSDVSYDAVTGQPGLSTTGMPLQIHYDSLSSQYDILLPADSFWEALYPTNELPNPRDFRTSGALHANTPVYFHLQEFAGTHYTYSALALWNITNAQGGIAGAVAFGIPTTAGAVPITGGATFNGTISGHSTETSFDTLAAGYFPALVEGTIALSFNFGEGILAGNISPTIYNLNRQALPPINFVNTVYSSGSTNFSGKFNTDLPGANTFSGLFTGPGAPEAIGSFAFPYKSPDDGKVYQANGAWVAKQ